MAVYDAYFLSFIRKVIRTMVMFVKYTLSLIWRIRLIASRKYSRYCLSSQLTGSQ